MSAIAIITLILAVPPALVALLLLNRAWGRQDNTDPTAPERNTARNACELTCVYAPEAFLVVSLFSFNYQNANPTAQRPGDSSSSVSPSLVGAQAGIVDGSGIDNSDAVSNDGIDAGLPQHRQDLPD